MGIKVRNLDEEENITDCRNEIPKKNIFQKSKTLTMARISLKLSQYF